MSAIIGGDVEGGEGEHPQHQPAPNKVIHEQNRLASAAAQPVRLGHHQLVAGLHAALDLFYELVAADRGKL